MTAAASATDDSDARAFGHVLHARYGRRPGPPRRGAQGAGDQSGARRARQLYRRLAAVLLRGAHAGPAGRGREAQYPPYADALSLRDLRVRLYSGAWALSLPDMRYRWAGYERRQRAADREYGN